MITQISGIKRQEIDVYCPTGAVITKEYSDVASRVSTLEGRRVGLLWNGKPNGDKFLDRVAEHLERKYKSSEIIKLWEVDSEFIAYKHSDAFLDRIANSADIVIAATGD